jgi:hypothetical protein
MELKASLAGPESLLTNPNILGISFLHLKIKMM